MLDGAWGATGVTPGGAGTALGPILGVTGGMVLSLLGVTAERTGAPFTGVSSICAAIKAIACAAAGRLPDRTAAKPMAKMSATVASLGRPFGSTGALASPHLRVSIRNAARASAR